MVPIPFSEFPARNNIIIYDISEKEKGTFKEIKTLEGHSGKINSIIHLNDKFLVSGGQGTYEIFYWDLNNNYNLQKLEGHTNNINYIIIFRYE